MNEWFMLGIGLVLTVGTGLFVASEFALVNLDRHDLEHREASGEKGLRPTIKALRITSTHLSSAQLGITLTTLLTGYTFEPAVSSLLEAPLSGLGVPDAAVYEASSPAGSIGTWVILRTAAFAAFSPRICPSASARGSNAPKAGRSDVARTVTRP